MPLPSEMRGKPENTPLATPYEPSLMIAALNISPDLVLFSTFFTVSQAALAADDADEAPRACIISAPLCCILGRNSFSTQLWSPIFEYRFSHQN